MLPGEELSRQRNQGKASFITCGGSFRYVKGTAINQCGWGTVSKKWGTVSRKEARR